MKQVKKKTFAQKKLILLACLIGALVIAVASFVIVRLILKNREDPNKITDPDFDIMEELGESYYLGIPLAYSPINSNQIQYLTVSQWNERNVEETFSIVRFPLYDNSFVFSFDDGTGTHDYLPSIIYEDSYFDYTSFYASDALVGGSSEMPKITYVCNAVGMLYFDERIPLSKDATERAAQLAEYGFDAKSPAVTFAYNVLDDNGNKVLDADGNEKIETKKITIGAKVITDAAYYFRIEGRDDYVYATTTPYFEYALMSLEEFIEARLTAAGIESDAAYAPKLTSDYKQWKNTVFDYTVDNEGKYTYTCSDGKTSPDPWEIPEGAQLYTKASEKNPVDFGIPGYWSSGDLDAGLPSPATNGGYREGTTSTQIFDLAAYKDVAELKYALKNIIGTKIGAQTVPLEFTAIGTKLPISFKADPADQDGTVVSFDNKDSIKYSYAISRIESVFFADRGEVSAEGTAVGASAEMVKVTYRYAVDGTVSPFGGKSCHAIIDLNDELLLANPDAAAAIEKLRAASVGALTESVGFDITYTKENSAKSTTKVIITDIFKVYDSTGTKLQKIVTDTSIVSFRYYYERDGVAISSEESITLWLSDVDEDSSQLYKDFKAALVGKKLALEQKIEVSSSDSYNQPLMTFTSYSISEISLFTTSELVVSFGFINSSKRDPFYSESIFDNTLGNDHQHGIYALNTTTCENVVDILGGTTKDASGAEGYIGTETVSAKLTPELMEKYGLYKNKIYFELPRGIYAPDYAEEYENVEYAWYETLGFTIYISDETFDEDGKLVRYAASTLYDTIVKVDPTDFRFLEYSFVDLWARRNLFMVDIKDIEGMDVTFNMSDLKGDYRVAFDHRYYYVSDKTGYAYVDENAVPEDETYQEYHKLNLGIVPVGDISTYTDSKLKAEYSSLETSKEFGDGISWTLMNALYGGGQTGADDTSTSNMKEYMRLLFNTSYMDTLTKDEQAEAKANGSLMTLKFKLDSSAYRYGYDFYRLDDRRVMVSIYRIDDTNGDVIGETSDFYIPTSAFKKIAGAFNAMLNGEALVNDTGYIDKK